MRQSIYGSGPVTDPDEMGVNLEKEFRMNIHDSDFVAHTKSENAIFIKNIFKDYLKFSAPSLGGYRLFFMQVQQDPNLEAYLDDGLTASWVYLQNLNWHNKYAGTNTSLKTYLEDLNLLVKPFNQLFKRVAAKNIKMFASQYAGCMQFLFFYIEYVLMGHALVRGLFSDAAKDEYEENLLKAGDEIRVVLKTLHMELGRLPDFKNRLANIHQESINRGVKWEPERKRWFKEFVNRVNST
ncbi:hypothetical protein JW711_00875 [Candidatus Woesearchaeota archaeon]|nr:hypothetical protein [Candidatus Woesearchaeota archaeon]